MFSTVLSLLPLFCLTRCQESGGCYTEGSTWSNEDVLSIQPAVSSASECQALCSGEAGCSYFTWYTGQHDHTPLFCVLFRSVHQELGCQNCMSGPASCYCSEGVGCKVVGDNVLEVITGVTEELDCQSLCAESEVCVYYTWYDSTGLLANTCMLFSSCDVMDETCTGCFSGPPSCSDIKPTPSTTTTSTTTTSTTTSEQPTTSSATRPTTTITTTTPTTTSPSSVCSGYNYKELSEVDRNINFNDGEGGVNYCDQEHTDGVDGVETSPDWAGEGWYRFVGEAGTRMPSMELPPMNSCGTHWPGWVRDTHPEQVGVEKEVRICFYNVGNGCNEEVMGLVVNCGGFFLYKLPETPSCSSRYCGRY